MRLFMIEIMVADLAVSLAWYRDRLGLTVRLHDEVNRFALLETGAVQLALKQGLASVTADSIVFEVAHLDGELQRLTTLGAPPEGPVKNSAEGYRQAFVRDPDGRRIGLFEWVNR